MFLLHSLTSFSQTSKTFVKSIPNNSNEVIVNINCDKKVNHWDNNFIRIELMVTSTLPIETLNSLVKIGRYDFDYKVENDYIIITLPKLNNEITIRGERVTEKISITIWLPEFSKISQETIIQ